MDNQSSPLARALGVERRGSYLRQAAMIRDWSDGPDRCEAAKALIRATFVDAALGRISQETESQVYTALASAMPGQMETAHQVQLARQDCPECGDGRCPVEPMQS